MTTTIDRSTLDRAREQAGITVTRYQKKVGSFIRGDRWIVRADETFRTFQAETDAEAFADDLALDLIEQGAIGELA